MRSPGSSKPFPGDMGQGFRAPGDARRLSAGVLADLLAAGHDVRVKVTGRSMYPGVRDGDTVVVSRPSRRPRRGDLVFYRTGPGDDLVLHRLVGFTSRDSGPAFCLTRGDSLPSPDEPVALHQILGLVTRIEREGPGGPEVLLLDGRSARVRGYLVVLSARARFRARRLARRVANVLMNRGEPDTGTGG